MNQAYFRYPKQIVHKDDLFNICKLSAKVITNVGSPLRDPNVIRICRFDTISFNDFATILGACKVAHKEHDIPFLSGIISLKIHNFISHKHLRKLIEIEDKYKINLSISKSIREKLIRHDTRNRLV